MSIPKWSDEYAIGIKAIDRDHEALFEEIGLLSKALLEEQSDEHVSQAIDCLESYTVEHFAREEGFMIHAGYPKTEAHIKSHKAMIRKIECLKKLHSDDADQLDRRKLVKFLSNWLSEHILKVDMDYVPYLHGKQADTDDDLEQKFHQVEVHIPELQRNTLEAFIRIITSDNPVARELAEAIVHFDHKLEEHDMDDARKLFCADQ